MQANISRQIASIASRSKTDDIFIIGKGPSIDELNGFTLPAGLVINLNDSEKIRTGDICIFSANWVRHSLADSGFKCSLYLAGKPLPSGVVHEVLPPLPLELDKEELSVYRLEKEDFYDEPLVLLNALKVCLWIAATRGHPQNVYLLGFDFSTQSGELSVRLGHDFAESPKSQREAIVHSQEYEYRQFERFLADGKRLRLIHVGHKDFSALSPDAFRKQFDHSGTVPIARTGGVGAAGEQVLIVAELTNNHLGDPHRLVQMVERAKAAGADMIKVQKRDVDTFYSPEELRSYYWSPFGNTLGDYRRGVELNDDLVSLLDETCKRCEIEWFSSVLDYLSYEALQRFGPRLLKIPSTISNHREFHERLAADYQGPIVVSTGFTSQAYEDYVLRTFSRNETLYLLHCVSAYPAPREACNLAVIRHYLELSRENAKIIPGYSSHDLGSVGSMIAVASGARMIEKHVKLGDVDWVHFDKVAVDLNSTGFAEFVNDIRTAEMMLGSTQKRLLECEHHKYRNRP